MEGIIHIQKTFEKVTYIDKKINNREFEDCVFKNCDFSNKKMPKTKFINCSVREVTFIGTNLTSSVFDNCDLDGAIFNETQLAAVDFRTAYNYKIDPEFNPMRKAQFSNQGIVGLLDKYDIKII